MPSLHMILGWPTPLFIFVFGWSGSALWFFGGLLIGRYFARPLVDATIEKRLAAHKPSISDATILFLTCLLLGPGGWLLYVFGDHGNQTA